MSRDPNPDVHGTLSSRVLSMLIPLFSSPPDLPNVSDVSIELEDAVHALDAYCARSVEQAENVFASRQYALADYVRYVSSNCLYFFLMSVTVISGVY